MRTIRPISLLKAGFCGLLALSLSLTIATSASAAGYSAQVKEAQTIMTRFGIPTGPIDGEFGQQTQRGVCAFRMISGYTPNRNNVNSALLTKLRSFNTTYTGLDPIKQISAPQLDGHSTYVLVNQTCQALVYVQNGKYQKVIAVSTGRAGHETPNGHWYLGYTDSHNGHPAGWSCSTAYPDMTDGACYHHPGVGKYSTYSDEGNMYDKRHVVGGVFLHGSTSVPTYPASHGCIRVTPADSDWMYAHVGNDAKPYIKIVGAY